MDMKLKAGDRVIVIYKDDTSDDKAFNALLNAVRDQFTSSFTGVTVATFNGFGTFVFADE